MLMRADALIISFFLLGMYFSIIAIFVLLPALNGYMEKCSVMAKLP